MTSDRILHDLRRSYFKFSRQIGDFRKYDVESLMTQSLRLEGASRRLVAMFVDQTFKREAKNDRIRTDGVLIELIKEEIEKRGGSVTGDPK